MEMRTVYRYENDLGRGPYRGGEWPGMYTMCDDHMGMHHPTWALDFSYDQFEDDNPRPYLAACASREALDAWFDGWHQALAENGYRVVEYTVPAENVVDSESGLQVAFRH